MVLKLKTKATKATLHSPELVEEKELICYPEGEYVVIEVPADVVRCYAVIEVSLGSKSGGSPAVRSHLRSHSW